MSKIFKNGKMLTPIKELQELRAEIIKDGLNRSGEFLDWVIPFLAPGIRAALDLGWTMEVNLASVWMYKGFNRVLLSGTIEADGNKWIHLSISHQNALPHYTTLKMVKNLFLGEDSTALQVFPPKPKYVNDMPFCLHLWVCLDKEIVPDFRKTIPGKPDKLSV